MGTALLDTLDEMVLGNRIEPHIAMKILADFDKTMADTLAVRVNARLNFRVGAQELEALYIELVS